MADKAPQVARKGEVKENDGSSDGAKRYLVRNCS